MIAWVHIVYWGHIAHTLSVNGRSQIKPCTVCSEQGDRVAEATGWLHSSEVLVVLTGRSQELLLLTADSAGPPLHPQSAQYSWQQRQHGRES